MSAKVRRCKAGVPTSSIGVRITPATGVTRCGPAEPWPASADSIETALAAPKPSVCPSGALPASNRIASVPAAPERFSTRMGTPNCVARRSANPRATWSLTPPGGWATRMRIGRVGKLSSV